MYIGCMSNICREHQLSSMCSEHVHCTLLGREMGLVTFQYDWYHFCFIMLSPAKIQRILICILISQEGTLESVATHRRSHRKPFIAGIYPHLSITWLGTDQNPLDFSWSQHNEAKLVPVILRGHQSHLSPLECTMYMLTVDG